MLHIGLLIAAVVIFAIDAITYWGTSTDWRGRLQSVGLAFFAASFIVTG